MRTILPSRWHHWSEDYSPWLICLFVKVFNSYRIFGSHWQRYWKFNWKFIDIEILYVFEGISFHPLCSLSLFLMRFVYFCHSQYTTTHGHFTFRLRHFRFFINHWKYRYRRNLDYWSIISKSCCSVQVFSNVLNILIFY